MDLEISIKFCVSLTFLTFYYLKSAENDCTMEKMFYECVSKLNLQPSTGQDNQTVKILLLMIITALMNHDRRFIYRMLFNCQRYNSYLLNIYISFSRNNNEISGTC
jgi:hypothetical protein